MRGGVEYVQLQGSGVDLVVLSEDWDIILPLVKAGYFSDPIYPAAVYGTTSKDDPSSEASPRHFLYQRTLLKLQELFPQDYPTPRL